MKYYLVKENKVFLDNKGGEDDGGTRKFITTDPNYLKLKNKTFSCEISLTYGDPEDEIDEYIEDEEIDPEDSDGPMDGYNCEAYQYEVKVITKEKAEEYEKLIKQYEKI
jgi:hypothetical protein